MRLLCVLHPLFLVAGLLSVTPLAKAELLATDRFDYPEGNIDEQAGGAGFFNPWSGRAVVTAGSLTYVDTAGRVLASVGNRLSTTADPSGGLRRLVTTERTAGLVDSTGRFGVPGSHIYIAFLVRLDSGSIDSYGDYAGVSFFDGRNEQLFFGDPGFSGDLTSWGVDPQEGPAAVRSSTVPVDGTVRLIVGRIDFAEDKATVRLYVDPSLGTEPETATVGPFSMPDFRFDRIRIQSGGNGRYSFDELAVGTSYADVAPLPAARAVSP